MSIFGKIGRSIVYHTTEKPSHYVHVDKPKSLQDLRQIQYNNWCKTKGVYNGSYLPSNPNKLYKKGWEHYNNPNYKHTLNESRSLLEKVLGKLLDLMMRKLILKVEILKMNIINGIMIHLKQDTKPL